jgi:hypothetical protein
MPPYGILLADSTIAYSSENNDFPAQRLNIIYIYAEAD